MPRIVKSLYSELRHSASSGPSRFLRIMAVNFDRTVPKSQAWLGRERTAKSANTARRVTQRLLRPSLIGVCALPDCRDAARENYTPKIAGLELWRASFGDSRAKKKRELDGSLNLPAVALVSSPGRR